MNFPGFPAPSTTPATAAAPAPAPAGFFGSDVNGMDASQKLPFFPSGFIGYVKVSACKGITRRNGERAFVAELEVMTTNMPDAVQVGSKRSWFQGLREPGTSYPACIAFLYACLGLDQVRDKAKIETEVKPNQDKYLNHAVSAANPLAGATLGLQTSNKKLKDGVTDFTLHTFSAAPKQAT